MEESRKRLIGLMAAILTAMHMQRADDLFRMPNGSPITDRIMQKLTISIQNRCEHPCRRTRPSVIGRMIVA